MLDIAIFRRIRTAAGRFARDDRGNIAILFGIVLVPILTFVGTAIDYTRATAARASMQAALDSTALMLAKDLTDGNITTSQISTKAQAYFTALFNNKEAQSITVSATYTASTGQGATIKVTGSGNIPTDFLKVAGFPNIGFDAASTSAWGANLLRVALVLDNTGSMNSSNKIGALKTASKNLVTQLSGLSKNDGDVYISVVPFEIDVNVGTSNVSASWLRWDTWDPSNYQNSSSPWDTWCNNGYWLTMAQCKGRGYTWNHTPNISNKGQWNGCVTDRDQNYDLSSAAPSALSTQFIADQDQSCPVAPILPLTYNWNTVNATIDSMTAQGATNQTIGLQWGWLSLLQQAPLNAPSEDSTKIYKHIIILFTDGLNTGDRWYGDFSSQSSQVDARMQTMCDNVKATGVTIYTVQIDTDGAGQSAVLPYCASASNNFFMLTDPSQISAAFAQIGTSISKLRVAK